MSKPGATPHVGVSIGTEAKPPFAVLPDPAIVFAKRSARFAALSEGQILGPYLTFLGGLVAVQHRLLDGLPPVEMPPADALARAREFGMPPLDRNRFAPDRAYAEVEDRLLTLARDLAMPEAARAALDRVVALDQPGRELMARAVLSDSIPVETMAEHVFIAAALQVQFARAAARLDAKALAPVGDGACPVCGGPPVASLLVEWPDAQNTRFCACALCQTLWNYVRIKCTLCGSTGGIGYQEVAELEGAVKAETCDSCGCYLKIMHQAKDRDVEPIADDVATLGLDLLVRDTGKRRGGFNPFLLGY